MLFRAVQTRLDVFFSDELGTVDEQEVEALLLDCRSIIIPLPIQAFETLCARDNVGDRDSTISLALQAWFLLVSWGMKQQKREPTARHQSNKKDENTVHPCKNNFLS